MKYIVTTCSRGKLDNVEDLPALKRYTGEVIKKVYRESIDRGLPFLIFSGKYGLLKPESPIPYYDYLLPKENISETVKLLREQIKDLNITEIEFHHESGSGWQAYIEAIKNLQDEIKVEFIVEDKIENNEKQKIPR